ncbi:MAG: carboxy terminal-processing peptidase [Deltaproteobacteria bacterium]|nr:carboxy terminal-processing peptidase [Deltaproteobacteria bacterium]
MKVHTVQGAKGPVKVGVIEVPSFYLDANAREAGDPNYNNTTADVRALLDQLRKQRVDVVAIDLRENGGGSLSEAVSLTGLFIDTGPVVHIWDNKSKPEFMADETAGTSWDGPLVVLTSDLSASASEIFAGAIQDYGRGLIVGSPSTHGKGTVQTVMDLEPVFRASTRGAPDEPVAGALKLTTHTFFRVSGGSTQLEGVHADVVIPSPWEGLEIAEKDLDHALPWTKIQPPVPYEPVGEPRGLAVPLQRASDARVASEQWFKWQAEDVAERKAEKDKKVSLNLEERKKEKARFEVKRAERGLAPVPDPENPGAEPEPPEAPDYILEESLKVTADFYAALNATAAN